jgi:hypothetical protein
MQPSVVPSLAPPGAGLPPVELFLARIGFGILRRFRSRAAVDLTFRAERSRIRALVDAHTPAEASQRVLIPRLRGLEDSSRYWSIWMTLDHLRIVNLAVAGTIRSLGRGETPPGRASTADVKPRVDAGPDVDAPYEAACEDLLEAARETSSLSTAARYSHPWFGPLDAAGWHTLGALHMGIHRRQIERIAAGR